MIWRDTGTTAIQKRFDPPSMGGLQDGVLMAEPVLARYCWSLDREYGNKRRINLSDQLWRASCGARIDFEPYSPFASDENKACGLFGVELLSLRYRCLTSLPSNTVPQSMAPNNEPSQNRYHRLRLLVVRPTYMLPIGFKWEHRTG